MYKLENFTDVVFGSIDHKDAPEYSEAYIESAKYNGVELTGEECEAITDATDLETQLLFEDLKHDFIINQIKW